MELVHPRGDPFFHLPVGFAIVGEVDIGDEVISGLLRQIEHIVLFPTYPHPPIQHLPQASNFPFAGAPASEMVLVAVGGGELVEPTEYRVEVAGDRKSTRLN